VAWNIRTSRQFTPDLEILVHQVNVDVAASIVLDASAAPSDPVTGELRVLAGTPLKKVGNQYQPWASGDGSGALLGILARTERFPDNTAKSDLPSAMWNHGQWFRADRIVGWGTAGVPALVRAALPTCKFS
jgi:hypothetical protein